MRILAITNMYPSPGAPVNGVFVEEQIKGLLSIGLQVRVVFIDRRREGAMAYYRMAPVVRAAVKEFDPDLVHVMYGGVMADQITSWKSMPPVVVTFHGSDLLGENLSGFVRKWLSHHGVHCSRKAARKAPGVVVVARHLVNALNGVISPEKLRVIPCGIDLARFKPMDQSFCRQRLGWQPDSFHVGRERSGQASLACPRCGGTYDERGCSCNAARSFRSAQQRSPGLDQCQRCPSPDLSS